jgi:type IV secretory pathway component VirB8
LKKIDEQRYLWILRVFGIFIALSLILNIVLLSSFNKISPTTKWEAFFVESQDKNIDNLYIQRSSDLNISQNSVGYQIAKTYIIQYIIERETLYTNSSIMKNLWGIDSNLFFMSSENTYKTFYTSPEFKNGLLNPKKEVITVSVNPDNIQYHSKSNIWEAIVTTHITDEFGLNKRSEVKKIQIKAKFLETPYKKNSKSIWKNPLGFVIEEYIYIK